MNISGWVAMVLSVAALWMAAWIFIPPPTYFLLRFAVGAPELCAWTGVRRVVAIVFGLGTRRARTSRSCPS